MRDSHFHRPDFESTQSRDRTVMPVTAGHKTAGRQRPLLHPAVCNAGTYLLSEEEAVGRLQAVLGWLGAAPRHLLPGGGQDTTARESGTRQHRDEVLGQTWGLWHSAGESSSDRSPVRPGARGLGSPLHGSALAPRPAPGDGWNAGSHHGLAACPPAPTPPVGRTWLDACARRLKDRGHHRLSRLCARDLQAHHILFVNIECTK